MVTSTVLQGEAFHSVVLSLFHCDPGALVLVTAALIGDEDVLTPACS